MEKDIEGRKNQSMIRFDVVLHFIQRSLPIILSDFRFLNV